jgi:hypothetical protein
MAELNRCAKCGSKAELIFFKSYGERHWPMAVVKCTSCDNEEAMPVPPLDQNEPPDGGRAAAVHAKHGFAMTAAAVEAWDEKNPGPTAA